MTNEPGESDNWVWQIQPGSECEFQSGTKKAGGRREDPVSSLGQIQ